MGGNWAADYECIVRLTAYQWEDLCWSSGEAWDGWDGRDSPSVEDKYRGGLGWMPSRRSWCSHCSWTHNLNHHSCCLNLNHFHSSHLFPPAWSPLSSSVQQERWWPQWSCSGGETGSWVWWPPLIWPPLLAAQSDRTWPRGEKIARSHHTAQDTSRRKMRSETGALLHCTCNTISPCQPLSNIRLSDVFRLM